MKSARGLAGVTEEIRNYETSRFPHLEDHALVIPNGFNFHRSSVALNLRKPNQFDFVFVCAEFSTWHGLDRLLSAIEAHGTPLGRAITIHLVGRLTDLQRNMLDSSEVEGVTFVRYGTLSPAETSTVLAECHVAIGSLALDRKGLTEAGTLKVREYLAAGLPVYATHKDASIPKDFPYYMNDQDGVSIENIVRFAEQSEGLSRETVREASKLYLDKEKIMISTLSQLEQMFPSRVG